MENAFAAPLKDTRQARVAVFAFLAGNGVSLVGNTLILVALPWFVLETTGSAARTGIIGMATALPAFVAGIFGGMLVDRIGGRRMSVIADILSGVAIALVPLLHLTTGLSFPMLVVLVFAGAALDIPGVSARRALLPELGSRARLRPEAMVSAFESMQSIAFVIGPAIAGGLIALIGSVNLLWITAGGFLLSAICIGLFAPAGLHAQSDTPEPSSGTLAELKLGLRYLATDSLLLWLAIGLTAMNFLVTPFWSVTLPVLIDQRFGLAAQLGLLFTALGAGSVVGTVIYGAWGHLVRHRRRVVYLVGVTSFCVMVWLFLQDLPFGALLAVAFVEGAISGPINPLLVNVRLERIPSHLRGRVFATFSGLAAAAIPVGMLVNGWLLEQVGLDRGIAIIAIVATVFTLGLWLARPLHQMNATIVREAGHQGSS